MGGGGPLVIDYSGGLRGALASQPRVSGGLGGAGPAVPAPMSFAPRGADTTPSARDAIRTLAKVGGLGGLRDRNEKGAEPKGTPAAPVAPVIDAANLARTSTGIPSVPRGAIIRENLPSLSGSPDSTSATPPIVSAADLQRPPAFAGGGLAGAVRQRRAMRLPTDVRIAAAIVRAPRPYARGGLADAAPEAPEVQWHGDSGLLWDESGGRGDQILAKLLRGSYVLPADVVSGLGEGNTLAGAQMLANYVPEGWAADLTGKPMGRAAGGRAGSGDERIRVRLSGGEYLVSPGQLLAIGRGDAREGARALDAFVSAVRGRTIDAIAAMPPPR